MSLHVVLLTDGDDFETVLPALDSFAHTVERVPLNGGGNRMRNLSHAVSHAADVAIIDARTNPVAARQLCRRLTTDLPGLAVVAVVAPTNFGAVDVDWQFDDVVFSAAGADEFQARLRLAINRRRSAVDGTLRFGDLVLHPNSFTGSLNGDDLCLTPTEFRLLNFLVEHAGRAFTRTRLMHEAWGYDFDGRVRTVDVHVRRLRAKFGPARQGLILTVRGVGYMVPTPPHPEWIVADPTLTTVWTSTAATATNSIALERH